MTTANVYKEYRQTQITTASQASLILMMYEGAMRFTRQAMDSLDGQDPAGMVRSIQKARDIVNELSLSLNVPQGGEAAARLESLYQFILSQLTLANIKADRAPLEAVLRVLKPLAGAWQDVANGQAEPAEPPKATRA